MSSTGIVIIGRNEGERLRACFASVARQARADIPVVYVDSGSTDGSVVLARSMGAIVVELDLSTPFTAARARNTGFFKLKALHPDLQFVQFLDGDCELAEGWIAEAERFLNVEPAVVVVCGRRQEKYIGHSVYNLLCDIEWEGRQGPVRSCGGDALIRSSAFEAVGGFRESQIAGEEPDLCARLREAGWQVWFLDFDMSLHDAAIDRFAQWWRRTVRSGHAYAENAYRHRGEKGSHFRRHVLSAILWGGVLPLFVLGTVVAVGPLGLLLLLVYPVQVLRIARRGSRSRRVNLIWASFLMIGKSAELVGVGRFLLGRIRRAQALIIEYK